MHQMNRWLMMIRCMRVAVDWRGTWGLIMIPGANMALRQDLSKTCLSLFYWSCRYVHDCPLNEEEAFQIMAIASEKSIRGSR